MDNFKNFITTNIRRFAMVIALVGIAILFELLTNGSLLTPLNITNIIMQNGYIIVLAIGMTLVIITAEIDLSVGSVAAFIGAVSGVLLVTLDIPVFLAIIICLILGAVIGAWQGFWVAYVKIPAFIVTLAGMLIFRGLTLIVLQGSTLAPFPDGFRSISSAFLPDILSGGSELQLTTLIVGILLSILLIINELRLRRTNIKFGFNILSFPLFVGKLVVLTAIINAFT